MSTEVIELKSEPPEPLRLIERAIESGYKSEDLKVLFDLYNQRTVDLAREAFHRALVAAQGEMPSVVRDKANPQTRSMYATLETIQRACKPAWERHGFALSFGEDDCPLEGYKRTVCDVRHVAGHSARYWIDLPLDGIGPKGNAIGGMNRVQGAISSGSYGQRILTCRVFGIVIADSDQDGNERPAPLSREQAPLSREQMAQINDMIDDCAQVGHPVNLANMLQWLASTCKCPINSLEEIPAHKFTDLVALLNRKRRTKKETA